MKMQPGTTGFASIRTPFDSTPPTQLSATSSDALPRAFAEALATANLIVPLLDDIFGRAADHILAGDFGALAHLVESVEGAASASGFTATAPSELVRAGAYQIGGLTRLTRWVRTGSEASELAVSLGERKRKLVLELFRRPSRFSELRRALAPSDAQQVNSNVLTPDLRDLESRGFVRRLPVTRGAYMLTSTGYRVARYLKDISAEPTQILRTAARRPAASRLLSSSLGVGRDSKAA